MPVLSQLPTVFFHRIARWKNLSQKPDLAFVPSLQRRRLSQTQGLFFYLAHELCRDLPFEIQQRLPMVYASVYGEDSLTRRIVREYHELGEVSPTRFSTSVYNAAPGLYSIFTKNVASYTTVAAGERTAEIGLLEALLMPGLRLWILADEPVMPEACAVGALLCDVPGEEDVRVATLAPGEASMPAVMPLDQLMKFLSGEEPLLQTRSFTLIAHSKPCAL